MLAIVDVVPSVVTPAVGTVHLLVGIRLLQEYTPWCPLSWAQGWQMFIRRVVASPVGEGGVNDVWSVC